MSPDLLSRLYWTWRRLFETHAAPNGGTCAEFGGAHGDGWFALVDALCQILCDRADSRGRVPPLVMQVTEQHGGLCVELRDSDDAFSIGAIRMAERVSHRICELSGKPGRLFKRDTRFRTLAPDVGPGEGYERVGQHGIWIADGLVPYPPLPRSEVSQFLMDHWGPFLSGEPDIPGGWLHVADSMLEEISIGKRCDCLGETYFEQLQDSPTGLVARAVTGALEHRGIIALARALAKRTDRETGCLDQEASNARLL